MFKSFKKLQTQQGFTLVELMVVVAIIGLLSAVAIPNFQKYQARAKTSEAKLQLSAAYTAEASFYADYNMYATCLDYMGFDPSAEVSSRYYGVGFNVIGTIAGAPYTSAQNAGLNAVACTNGIAAASQATTGGRSYFAPGKTIGTSVADASHLANTAFADQSIDANMTYVIGAAGIIQQKFITNTNSSALTMNQAKVLSNVRNGY